jgi:hypothetical protein
MADYLFPKVHYETRDPLVTDDINLGFVQGQVWVNQSTNKIFQCYSTSSGAAIWKQSITDPISLDGLELFQDIVGAMITAPNQEYGIVVTYDDPSGKLNFDVNDFTLSLTGDVTGSAQIVNCSDTTITATFNPNSTAGNADKLDGLHKTSFGASIANNGNNLRLVNSDSTSISEITVAYATNADTLDNLHKTSFGNSIANNGNNLRLVNSDGTSISEITVNYASNSDTLDGVHKTALGANIVNSGNNIKLLNSDGTSISEITVNYATSASNADTLDGYHYNSFGSYLDTGSSFVERPGLNPKTYTLLQDSAGNVRNSILIPYAENAGNVGWYATRDITYGWNSANHAMYLSAIGGINFITGVNDVNSGNHRMRINDGQIDFVVFAKAYSGIETNAINANELGYYYHGTQLDFSMTGVFSDINIKTDIHYITDNIVDKINLLKPVTFKYKQLDDFDISYLNTDRTNYGLIAQEAELVFDNIVVDKVVTKFNSEDKKTIKTIEYEKIVPILIKAIQELSEEIKNIKSELNLSK